MSLRSIILVMVAPVLGPLFNLILCLIDCLLLFSFSFAVFFAALLALLFLSIVYSVTYYDISHTGVISDTSLTEALQESLLFSSICIYVYIVKRYYAKGLILVAGF